MKYIKTYEGVDKNSVKLAIAFVNFIKEIKPELNVSYRQGKIGVSYNYKYSVKYDSDQVTDSVYIHDEQIIMIYETSFPLPIEHCRIVLCFDINNYFTKKELDNLENFLFDENHMISGSKLTKGLLVNYKIPEFIEKLTKENYDNYLIQQNADKYNL